MKIDRLIAILLYLLAHEKVTARELSSYFDVTPRTIYRDMETLALAGVPIFASPGMDGGYGLVESFRLDRAFFKEEELLALFTALKGINAAIKDKSIDSVLLKLKALSARPRSLRGRPEELPPILYVPIPWGMPSDCAQWLSKIRQAIDRRRVLSFMYTKSDGSSTRRRVEPLTLVLQADVWYLYAWDTGRRDYRFFRLSRLSDLTVEQLSFKRRPGRRPFPWEGGWNSGPSTVVQLRFSPCAAQKARDVFPWEQPQVQEDGSLSFSMSFPYDDWVESRIRSFGPQVEVIQPEWVRRRISELAGSIAGRYRNTDTQLSGTSR
jgi:predicted DNA-binding transcriptional regulator YafY